ncbi:MAG: methylenetetrahydrofolate reductase [NAD(P)H] [Bacteroidota bacterium]|nr:methylenetetrahydrofolate reductase [NAD(P)H] [Bacteroidota bacterium]
MTVKQILDKAKSPLFTFELLPPLKGHSLERVYRAIDRLIKFEPAYINFTSHRNEVIYKERPDGLLEKRTIRKRPGTIAMAAAVRYKYNITVVPHMLVGGFTKQETENALIEMNFLGIDDVLALRGDPPMGSRMFIPERGGHKYALDLVKQIVNMNKGIYIDEVEHTTPMNFCIGVAGYPEKHIESPNVKFDLEMLKKKVDAGADYIVTQMFYDNSKFFSFVDRCREAGITVPIIPGIKPIITMNDMHVLPQTFKIEMPEELINELGKCKTNKEAWQVGIDWATMQSKELLAHDVPGIHYYTFGSSDNISRIVKASY